MGTFELEITGLFLCVLDRDITAPTQMDVVAVRGEPVNLPHHCPLLTLPAEALDDESSPADGVIWLPDKKRYAFWNLSQCEIVFATGLQPQLKCDNKLPKDIEVPKDPEQEYSWRDFGWLPSLTKATKGSFVDPAHLQRPPAPDSPASALIRFRQGEFYGMLPSKNTDKPPVWKYKDGNKVTHARALTDRACLDIPFKDSLRIRLNRFDGWFREVVVDSTVRATLSCLPTEGHQQHVRGGPVRVEHFKAYYELLVKPPALDKRPVPELPGGYDHGGGSSECPPGGGARGK
jgi:hypothetical protein